MGDTLRLTTDQMKSLEKQMFSLSDTADTVAKATEGMAKSIGNAANESKIWTAASRILSGTGLWKMQNYLRGGIQLLTFYKDAQVKAIKSQNESMKSLAALGDEYKVVAAKTQELKDILDENFSPFIDFEQAKKDNLELKLQMDSMTQAIKDELITREEAEEMAVKRTLKIYEYQEKQMSKLLDKRNKLVEKDLKRDAARNKIKEGLAAKAAFKQKKVDIKGLKELKALDDKREALRKMAQGRMNLPLYMDQSQAKAKYEKMKEKGEGFGARGMGAQKRNQMNEQLNKLLEEQLAYQESLPTAKEGLTEGIGFGNFGKDFGKLKTFLIEKFEFAEKIEKIKLGFSKLRLNVAFNVGKLVGFALRYAMFFVLFIVGAFLIFEIIKQISGAGDLMGTVVTMIVDIMGGLFMVVEGFMLIFSAFFGGGTFGERLGTLLTGFGKIFGGLGTIIFAVMKGIVKFAIGLVVGVIVTIVTGYWRLVMGIVDLIMNWEDHKRRLGEWWEKLALWEKLGTWFSNQWSRISTWIGEKIEALRQAIKPTNMLKGLVGMANGGVAAGGMTLVGERGPELVNLPRGARVHSNNDSKKMLSSGGGNTTINVSVNGRLGASDSELRDIAKKVGRMVSAEINRSTSSSTNVRY